MVQSNKSQDQQITEARRALGGKETHDTINKNSTEATVELITPTLNKKNTTEASVKTNKKKDTVSEKSTRTTPQRKTEREAFLEKIRPKAKHDNPVITRSEKKIERVLQQKTSTSKRYNIQTIRTYKSDVADAVKKRGESLAKIIVKRKEKRREYKKINKTTERKAPRNILILTGILISIISGGILVYKLNWTKNFSHMFQKTIKNQNETSKPTVPLEQSLVRTDTEVAIDISTKKSVAGTIADELAKTRKTNNTENIYLYKAIRTLVDGKDKQQKEAATVQDLISSWTNDVPNMLTRSLEKEFMIGIYSTTENTNIPFLIFTTNSYIQTFAGMIKWEQTLPFDFYKLFNISIATKANTAFIDKVIDGKDTRVLTDTTGKILILYSFINKKTVVITTSEAVFIEILQQINK